MIFILDVEDPQTGSVKGLKVEKKRIKEKLDLNKDKLKTDFQLLRYSLLDSLMKELLSPFTRKKKTPKTGSGTASKSDPKTPRPKKRTRKKE